MSFVRKMKWIYLFFIITFAPETDSYGGDNSGYYDGDPSPSNGNYDSQGISDGSYYGTQGNADENYDSQGSLGGNYGYQDNTQVSVDNPGGWDPNNAGSWNHVTGGTWRSDDGAEGTWSQNHVITRNYITDDDGNQKGWTETHVYTGRVSGSTQVVSSGGYGNNPLYKEIWLKKLQQLIANGFKGFTDPWRTSMERSGVYFSVEHDHGSSGGEYGTGNEEEHNEKHDFDYNRHSFYGPENWSFFWSHCMGKKQSPIDIEDNRRTYSDFTITFSDRPDNGFRGKFFNNGHAPTFALITDGSTVSGLPTTPNDKYKLIQFHFHFACDPEGGSEHTLNGHRLDAEMHMVHYNMKYNSFDEAMDKPDGLAVIAVFFRAHSSSYSQFDKFIVKNEYYLLDVSETGKETYFDPFLLVPNNKEAYCYSGSLTTPGCLESVSWILLRNPVDINPNTMRVFRAMHDGHGDERIVKDGNCRPIQPLGDRIIMANF